MKKIPLSTWAAERWDPPPSQWVLTQWVRKGEIHPPAEKVGARYYVLPTAQRLTGNEALDSMTGRPSLVDRLRAAP